MIEKEVLHPIKRTADLAGLLRLNKTCDIFENNEILYYEYSRTVFSGTVIEITINVDNLQDLDEDDFKFE